MDTLTALSAFTGGLESFGEDGQLMAASSGYKQQANLLDMEAKGTIASGDLAANKVRIQGDKIVARQRSIFAKAGVKFTGSPASVWAETERNIQLDVVNTKLNAASKANAIGFQALQARIAAGNAKTAAWMKASQGLLQIGTSMAMAGGGTAKGGVNINAGGGGGQSGMLPKGMGVDTSSLYMS
jgi:hypothetical protein